MKFRLGQICWLALLVLGFGDATAAHAAPLRIMPLGDSLTRGLNCCGNVPGGYRTRLYDRLSNELYPVDFVGSASDNPDPGDLPDPDHEGHGGYRIDEIAAGINGWLTAASPAVVLLHLGTNDVAQDYSLAGAPSRLDSLIMQIATQAPQTHVIVSQIITSTDAGEAAQINAYNSTIPGIVAAHSSAGRWVTMLNMNALVPVGDFVDGYHPGQAGYDKMADGWFGAISALGSIVNPPDPPGSNFLVTKETAGPSQVAYPASNTDLIDISQLGTTLAGVTHSGYAPFTGSGTTSAGALNDGLLGADFVNSNTAFDLDGTWTSSYQLDTSVNALGYDIAEIQSFAGWAGNRAGQSYELLFATVDNPGIFVSSGTFTLNYSDTGSSRMTITNPGGLLASGVAAIRFNFFGANGAVFREMDIFGTPTLAATVNGVPEPASCWMVLGLSLVRRGKRKA